MKSTGVVRKLDKLGRIVIPMSLRRQLGINEKDSIEIFVEHDKIILQKYPPHQECMLTGKVSSNNFILGNGKIILSPEGVEILYKELKKHFQTI